MKKLFVVTGCSCSGKTTIVQELLKRNSDLSRVVTCTTREKREGEVDGEDYFFFTKEEFFEKDSKGELVEHAKYAGNFYGASFDGIEKINREDKTGIIILEGKGLLNLKRAYENTISIFIDRGTEEIEKDMDKRNIPKNDKEKRIAQINKDKENIVLCDHNIKNNSTIEDAVKKIEEIIFTKEELGNADKEYKESI